MDKFNIETRGGDDYIISTVDGFKLLVIPPHKQPEFYALGRQVVGADFIGLDKNGQPNFDDHITYDFEGIDFAYFDDDCRQCNKDRWFEAIEYYCQLVLDLEPSGFSPYNYDYELTEANCSPECWAFLGGDRQADTNEKLPF